MAQVNKIHISTEKALAEQSKHLMLEMNYIMPDNKPRINSIVQTSVTPVISSSSLSGDSLEFSINADCNIIYNALAVSEADEHLYSTACSFTKSFKEIIVFNDNADELHASQSYTVDIACNNVETVLISDRKVIVKAYITVNTAMKVTDETEVIGSFDDTSIITRSENAESLRSVGIMRVQSFIKEDIKLYDELPAVDVIIKKNASISIDSKRISDSKAIFYGVMHGDIVFSNMQSDPQFYAHSFDLNFNQATEIPDVSENALLNIKSQVTELSVDPKENGILSVEALLSFEVEVFDFFSVSTVRDAFLPGMEFELKRENISGINTFILSNNIGVCSEKMSIPEGDIASVLYSSVTVNECNSYIEGKNIYFDGIYKITSLYIPKSDPNVLRTVTADVPYNYMFECGQIKGEVLFCLISTKSITSQLNEFGDITVKWVATADALIKEDYELDLVSFASATPLEKEEENAIYYHYVLPEESAWDIAKQFKVRPEDLCRMNNVDSESDLCKMHGVIVIKSNR